MEILKPGINYVTNSEYHGDTSYLSSSSLKLILKDARKFYKEHILGEKVNVSKSSFDEGSLTHAMILEPHVINEEFAFFDGIRKAGSEFQKFKEEHENKTIISKPQRLRCDKYFESYKARPEAVSLISGGEAEHTICVELNGVKVKVRCDYINIEKGYIVDVKTSAFSVDVETFSNTVNMWGYDVSAALYAMVAEKYYGQKFDFYFIAISKSEEVCEVFKLSQNKIEKGEEMVFCALDKFKKCKSTNNWTDNLKRVSIKIEDDYEILEI